MYLTVVNILHKRIFSICLIIFGIGVLFYIPTTRWYGVGSSDILGMVFMPRLTLFVLVFSCLFDLFLTDKEKKENVKYVTVVYAFISLLYIYLVMNVWLIVTTAIYLFCMIKFIRIIKSNPRLIFSLVLFGTAVIWVMFVLIADIFLPNPILF